MRKARALWTIATGLLGLAVILLLSGCLVPLPTGQASTALPGSGQATVHPGPLEATWIAPGNVTPLPSMCTSVEVTTRPSDAFRLKILVKNSAGAPAPGARVFVTFYDGDPNGPEQIWANDQGVAMLALTAEHLALPDASGHTAGVLGFDLAAFWNKPNSGPEYVATCASQDIDLTAPAEIVVTVTLLP